LTLSRACNTLKKERSSAALIFKIHHWRTLPNPKGDVIMHTPIPNWNDILPNVFNGAPFHQTARSRYRADIDGIRCGVVIAWRGLNYDNHALAKEDLDRLIEFKLNGKLDVSFVIAARRFKYSAHTYVAHCDAEELHEVLASVSPRHGDYGPYWLLRQDLKPLDFIPDF
jgi:hypothetical protein